MRAVFPAENNDAVMCDAVGNQHCLDSSFTGQVHPDYFTDNRHFREPVNRILNEQMLEALGYLPASYRELSTLAVMVPYNEPQMQAMLANMDGR